MAPIVITSFVTTGEPGKFKEAKREVDGLKPHEILIKIRASAICHTDCYYMGAPDLCLGHEPVGDVTQVGSDVGNFKVGDRAGFSYVKSACCMCSECIAGRDNYCPDRVMFPGDGNNNGFADQAVVDSRFAYHIPDAMSYVDAGPIMCAGATVFNSLFSTATSPTHRVAVVGVGGLGHLALQFAKKWGTEVVAISTSDSKKEEATSFGANEFLNSRKFDDAAFLSSVEKFDLIINTTSADLPYDQYMSLLKPLGKFLVVGVPTKPMQVEGLPLILNGSAMQGSQTGGRVSLNETLKFAARHNIRPQIEILPFTLDGLEQGIQRVLDNKARYRVVLTNEV
ncbi:GroES-like protein [Hesseltinella vesiculosa]|uniref:GroES-like protein n=1 Tax=Hesseltinella vesiculosa TaxID=101127 RepID=A0A1X2GXU0_9FUNG|nr:GroES-like protein [Hesseltinella vesiculosa]